MGATKTSNFTDRQNRLADLFKALGHPARIAILQEIIKARSCICNGLTAELGLAQATISQHLKALKEAGLIRGNVEGTRICYCINEREWKKARKELEAFFVAYENNETCC